MRPKRSSHLPGRSRYSDCKSVSDADIFSASNRNTMASPPSVCTSILEANNTMQQYLPSGIGVPPIVFGGMDSRDIAIRQDPVTARAIRRLSHGVSKLSANNSPPAPSSSQSRSHRCKFVSDEREICPDACLSNSLEQNDHIYPNTSRQILTTGSKRKWQSDRRTSDDHNRLMDVDRGDTKNSVQIPFTESTQHDCHETLSSCSSMLSVSTPFSSDHHSDDQEADEEDGNDEDGDDRLSTNYVLRSIHSCIDLSDLPMSAALSRRTRKQPVPPTVKHVASRSTGDSSDGVSMNVKVPRLASNMCAPFAVGARRAGRRFVGSMSLEQLQMKTSRRRYSQKHLPNRCGCRYSYKKYTTRSGKPGFVCACESSSSPHSSNSSVSNLGSTDRRTRHTSPGSCEDSANDEQSDFPATDFGCSPQKSLRKTIRTDSVVELKQVGRNWRKSDGHSSGPACHPSLFNPLHDDIDSDLEELLNDTWPLLSRRGQKGYIKGVQQAGQRYVRPSQSAIERRSATPTNRVLFVPSKLTPLVNNELSAPTVSSQNKRLGYRSMPTPPWMVSDVSDNDVRAIDETAFSTTDSKHKGFGSFKPIDSAAPPISDTNVGHKLLQRLGWEPGSGLGLNAQGIHNPIGCASFNVDQ